LRHALQLQSYSRMGRRRAGIRSFRPCFAGVLHPGRDTVEEALERAKEAIAGHLAALVPEGLPLPTKDVEIAEVQVEIA